MSIADKIETIAENVPKVFEAGKKSQYDMFWDNYQENGQRTSYNGAFAGNCWTVETFQPKYNIHPRFLQYGFWNNTINKDLVQLLANINISLDTSNCANISMAFQYSKFTRIGVIDCSAITSSMSGVFGNATNLETIDKLILTENVGFSGWFTSCAVLKNLTIEGTIGKNGFSVADSPLLTKESLTSIINALSTTTSGLTVTLSKTAVNNAFETASGLADGSTSPEWTSLTGTKTNWTISLA